MRAARMLLNLTVAAATSAGVIAGVAPAAWADSSGTGDQPVSIVVIEAGVLGVYADTYWATATSYAGGNVNVDLGDLYYTNTTEPGAGWDVTAAMTNLTPDSGDNSTPPLAYTNFTFFPGYDIGSVTSPGTFPEAGIPEPTTFTGSDYYSDPVNVAFFEPSVRGQVVQQGSTLGGSIPIDTQGWEYAGTITYTVMATPVL